VEGYRRDMASVAEGLYGRLRGRVCFAWFDPILKHGMANAYVSIGTNEAPRMSTQRRFCEVFDIVMSGPRTSIRTANPTVLAYCTSRDGCYRYRYK